MQGLKPAALPEPDCGTTEVVPCYKAHEFNILLCVFSICAEANLDVFALP